MHARQRCCFLQNCHIQNCGAIQLMGGSWFYIGTAYRISQKVYKKLNWNFCIYTLQIWKIVQKPLQHWNLHAYPLNFAYLLLPCQIYPKTRTCILVLSSFFLFLFLFKNFTQNIHANKSVFQGQMCQCQPYNDTCKILHNCRRMCAKEPNQVFEGIY